jgi:hypothetical protein
MQGNRTQDLGYLTPAGRGSCFLALAFYRLLLLPFYPYL